MKTITTNNRTLLFVEVPEDATDMECRTDVLAQCFDKDYRYIATTDTIHLVDKIAILGGGVFHSNSDWDSYFQSFLDKHSITGRHAIIEVL